MNETLRKCIEYRSQVDITYIWSCGSLFFTESGIIDNIINNDIVLKDSKDRLTIICISNIVKIDILNP